MGTVDPLHGYEQSRFHRGLKPIPSSPYKVDVFSIYVTSMNTVSRHCGGDSNHTYYVKNLIHSLTPGGLKFSVIHCSIIFKTV